jgi:hypothetical protein
MAFKKIQKGQASRAGLHGLNDGSELTKAGEPITKSGVRDLQVDSSFWEAISRLFVKLIVSDGHCGGTRADTVPIYGFFVYYHSFGFASPDGVLRCIAPLKPFALVSKMVNGGYWFLDQGGATPDMRA